MTTFTLQDLNQNLTNEENEAMDTLAKLGGGVGLKEVLFDYENAPEVPRETKDVLVGVLGSMHIGEGKSAQMGEVLPKPATQSEIDPIKLIDDMMSQFSIKLKLLATVIGKQARGNSQAEDQSNQSLQQCVALTLQQADWFKEMVGACIDEDMVREAVKDSVESEVEHYFSHQFDPTDHFDFGDAVQDAVSDQIDDVVRDRVMDSLEEVVAEKLSEASVSISF